ncbi:MAG: DNA-binding response regulator, partial [Rhodocyclaceae bacterium]|nr:DNA-binding response regulator [Rhodocyclaceae bacterium]
MASPIRILIADDHAIVRHGLRQILSDSEDMIVTGEANGGVQALQLAREGEWDVFLLDVSMPDKNGIDTLKQLKKEFPKMPVLMLSMHPEEHYAIRALKAGASGYLTKQSAPEQLVTAIRQVAGGKKYVSPSLAEELANAISDDSDKAPHEKLSDREYQTL